ncbi:AAA family ATPase [Deltaproteobacteria bacterium OttesenSCG-928-M10]|nr:AAA family ATPase [Deltaproteobacteria bacterium OttesenSCG-928-M10]
MVALNKFSANDLDFKARCERVNECAVSAEYYRELYPHGKRVRNNWMCGDIHGSHGGSFGVNINNFKWGDLAGGYPRGHDVVALVAAREGIRMGEALEHLEREFGLRDDAPAPVKAAPSPLPPKPRKDLPKAPTNGPPSKEWIYTDADGQELYRTQRWEKDGHQKACKTIKAEGVEAVPLWLPELLKGIEDHRPICITEGEPKAEALKAKFTKSGQPVVTTFASGVNGFNEGMARYFQGAKSLIVFVDSDDAGRAFGQRVAACLAKVLASDGEFIKIVEAPDPKFEGYDLVDFFADGGTLRQLQDAVNDAPLFVPPKEAVPVKRPMQVDLDDYDGRKCLGRGTMAYDWLLEDSLRRGQLGLICGPPGCGKGTFALQLSAALAAGSEAFNFWNVAAPAKVLFLSAEDDETIINNRLYFALHQLPEGQREEAASRIRAVPVQGRVAICTGDKGGTVDTENLADLDALVEAWKPDVVILDTLARFFGVDEIDNPAMTAACARLEEIISRHGCNMLLIHHSNKAGGDLVNEKPKMEAALTQTAIRGASALAGAVRWAFLMVPLSDGLADDIIGADAKGRPPGSYVAARVGKKNAGRTESILFLERTEHGLLSRVHPAGQTEKEEAAKADAHMLAAEVDRRTMTGEKPLSVTKGGREAFGWGTERAKKAGKLALEEGLLITVEKGRGSVLALPDFGTGANLVPVSLEGSDGGQYQLTSDNH